MSQQINLLNPSLIKKQSFVTPAGIALSIGLIAFGLIGLYVFENKQLTALETKNMATRHQLSDMKETINQLIANQRNQSGDSALVTKIQQLETKKMQQKSIIDAVNQNSIKTGKSYAALLRAFSKQSLDGLWITGLKIDEDAHNLSIKGRTLNADLVPEFIARLRAEPALNGKTFTDLNMVKVVPVPVKEKQVFAKTNDGKAPQLTATIQQPEYVEFTLQSVPDVDTGKQVAQNSQQLAGAAL